MQFKDIATWTVTPDHKAVPVNPYHEVYFINSKYEQFEKELKEHVYHCSPSLVSGDYPAEMFGRVIWQSRLRGAIKWNDVLPEAYERSNNDFEHYRQYCDSMDAFARQYLQLKQPNELPENNSNEGYVNFRNPFEDYPELAERLLHAASFWKVDDTWSATLAEINKVCEQLTIAKNANWQSK